MLAVWCCRSRMCMTSIYPCQACQARRRLSSKHFRSGNDCDAAAVRAIGCQRQTHAPLPSATDCNDLHDCLTAPSGESLARASWGCESSGSCIQSRAGRLHSIHTTLLTAHCSLLRRTARSCNRMLLQKRISSTVGQKVT